MQVLPENKKKTIIYLIVLLLAAGASGYLWFTSRSAPAVPPPTNASRTPSSQLLPFGNKIDTAILNSEKLRALVAPAPLVLTPEELGKTDLFQ